MRETKPMTFEDFLLPTKQEAVYKDVNVFSPSYIPDVFRYREKEWNLLGNLMASFLQRAPLQMYISGPPGTGKTHMVSKLVAGFNEKIAEKNLPFRFVMVNCREKTYETVIGTLAQQYDSTLKIGKKRTVDLMPIIVSGMGKYNTCFIFDEIDKIKEVVQRIDVKPFQSLFGCFSRFNEMYSVQNLVGCVVISNISNLDKKKTDPSTQSSFIPTRVYFKEYQAGEIRDILEERCKRGFEEGVINTKTIASFSKEVSAFSRDLRTVFKVFAGVGAYVQKHNHREISMDDLRAVMKITEIEETIEVIKALSQPQQIFMYVIARLQRKFPNDRYAVTSDAVWEGYQSFERAVNNGKEKLQEISYRHAMYVILKGMEGKGLFASGIKGKGRAGGQIGYYHVDERDFDTIYTAISEIIREDWGIEDAHLMKTIRLP